MGGGETETIGVCRTHEYTFRGPVRDVPRCSFGIVEDNIFATLQSEPARKLREQRD